MQADDIWELVEQYWMEYRGIILAIITIIIVWIIQRILVRAARRSVRKAQLPPAAANGIVLAIRLITVFIVFTILTSYAGLSTEALALSGFVGAAVGFASAQTIGNIIAGVYVILTRPFQVGEYVTIGGEEGIVREISLNYTRIEAPDGTRVLVPNRTVINEKLRRYRHVLQTADQEEESTALKKTLSFLRESISDKNEVYIYPFNLAVHISHRDIQPTMKAFDQVCHEWTEKFGYPPTYYISEVPPWHINYKFFITVEKPYKILELQPKFLKALMEKLEATKE